MMPFKTRVLQKPGFFQRLLGVAPKVNGVVEINNLLTEKKPSSIDVDVIQTIAHRYKLNLKKDYREETLDLYKSYLKFCLEDKHLEDNEVVELEHLKNLFQIEDREVENIHHDVVGIVYEKEVNKVIADGRLDKPQEDFLKKLQNRLRLPQKVADDIYKESASNYVKKFIDDAISDERLSPEEEEELEVITKSLGVNLDIDEQSQAVLDKYKLFWQIENSELPVLDAQVNLQKKESCHFYTSVDWLEQRKVTKRINYSGPTLRIKIAKGLYWRAGSMAIQPVSEDVWTLIDSGDLFLTNKRLIFMGSNGNKTIRIDKILDFNVFSNGVDIQKDSGKSPFLQFDHNTDIFTMILGRVISEY